MDATGAIIPTEQTDLRSPRIDIPRQLALYRASKLKLDELITRTYTLDEIVDGYEDMHAGELIRGVVVYS